MDIGRLEPVEITEVWQTEPLFTKWLERNADLLGDVLGLSIATIYHTRAMYRQLLCRSGREGRIR